MPGSVSWESDITHPSSAATRKHISSCILKAANWPYDAQVALV